MTRPIQFDEKQLFRAKMLRDDHKTEREYRAALVFLFIAENNHSAEEAASMFGIGLRTVFEDLERIRKPETVDKGVWGGGNNHLLSFEEEREFLDDFVRKAQEGSVLTMPELHELYNIRVGKKTPKSTFYRLLKRHNWRKVLCNKTPPQGCPEIQLEVEKQQSKWKWQKLD